MFRTTFTLASNQLIVTCAENCESKSSTMNDSIRKDVIKLANVDFVRSNPISWFSCYEKCQTCSFCWPSRTDSLFQLEVKKDLKAVDVEEEVANMRNMTV